MRGGSKAVWNFFENSSVLVLFGIPKAGVVDTQMPDDPSLIYV